MKSLRVQLEVKKAFHCFHGWQQNLEVSGQQKPLPW